MADPIAVDLERELSEPGEALAPAALAIAQLEYPRLDRRAYLSQIDDLGREAARRLSGLADRREQIIALNRFVFGTLGFAGNRDQYLDPRNSFLNDVIDRRLGIPITLSVVYIEIGRRAGLPLQGIGFPGHFLVGCDPEMPARHVIDVFEAGRLLSETDCLDLLREHVRTMVPEADPTTEVIWNPSFLAPADRRAVAIRMLGNLKAAYVALRSFHHARRTSDLLLALDPSAVSELRDRGLLAYHMEDFPAALQDLERYLRAVTREEAPGPRRAGAADPGQDEAEAEFKAIWEHIKNLRRRVASFN